MRMKKVMMMIMRFELRSMHLYIFCVNGLRKTILNNWLIKVSYKPIVDVVVDF